MEVWKKIKDFNISVNNNSYDYDEKIFENQIQCRWWFIFEICLWWFTAYK